jgi:A/G-specific adenine glycosylase
MAIQEIKKIRMELLRWYDKNRRAMPWRALPGHTSNPYHVWLSEIMAQQTTIAAVIPYFKKFIKKWPDVHALSIAQSDEIMRAWAGLGYYARARNLHACAKIISSKYDGIFPNDLENLRALPGIGEYTAAAISAIAFNKPANVVDGNVERIIARLYAIQTPLPAAKAEIKKRSAAIYEGFKSRPGDLAQAFMDLGAGVCIPAAPRCGVCPVASMCMGYKKGIAANLPVKKTKVRPVKHGFVYWITDGRGMVAIECRPPKGLLGGMAGFPTSTWEIDPDLIKPPDGFQTLKFKLLREIEVRHVFTHFELRLRWMACKVSKFSMPADYFWVNSVELTDIGMPTLFIKALNLLDKGGV